MSDERNPQPQDELSEEQLAQVSGAGGGGDGQQPTANLAPSVADAEKQGENKEVYLKVTLKDVLISG